MQLPLTPEDDRDNGERLRLEDGAMLLYPAFLAGQEADACFAQLLAATPWRQDALNFGGKRVPIPRLQAWVGDKHSHYGYSGLALSPLPWSPLLSDLKARVEALADAPFNSVLLNYYRDGRDSVSWHSDDEKELGPNPVIASLSLGATRRFELKHRHKSLPKAVCDLNHGSLLVMGNGVQRHWQHQVPKQPAITDARINLTFRYIHR